MVSQYFWPEDFRINELVAELVSRGHDITVLTGQPNYPDGVVFAEYAADPDRYSQYRGARVERVPMLARGRGGIRLALNYASFAVSATVYAVMALRPQRYDAIFVFEPSPVTVGLPAIALRALTGAPVAFWVLDQWPETLAAVGVVRSKSLLALIGRLVAFIYRRCDLLLAQSRALTEPIRKYTRPETPVEYFPNWSEGAYDDTAVEPAVEVPDDDGRFSVMFAGNIGESQNFPVILDAAERLKDDPRIRWLIVGDGRAAAMVRAEVARRGLDAKFLLLGRHPIARMPSFYKHASALLVSLKADPIFSMTVPGKIQSYLAFGLPILGVLDGEGARIIEEAGAGFTVAAGDAARLAESIRRMADLSATARREMGARGAAYARREFDRDLLVSRLESMLMRLSCPPPVARI